MDRKVKVRKERPSGKLKKYARSSSYLLVAALFLTTLSLGGCSDLKDKFVRKKKPKAEAKRYYAVKTYYITPSIELYTKRYVLWKNWQRELEAVLNDPNFKKPRMAADQCLSNLVDMRNMLVDEKGDLLQKFIDDMAWVEKTIRTERVTRGNQVQLKKRIEIVGAEVQRKFSYNDMRKYIRDAFRSQDAARAALEEEEPAPGEEASASPSEAETPVIIAGEGTQTGQEDEPAAE